MSQRTRDVINAVRRTPDIRFVAATGRTPGWLAPLLDWGYDGLAVCDNGAVTYDIKTETVLHADLIKADTVAAVIADFAAQVPGAYFGVNRIVPDPKSQFAEPGYVARWDYGQIGIERDRLGDEAAAKIIVKDPEYLSDALGELLIPIAEDRVTIAWSQIHEGLIECSAPGVTKATAIARLAAQWEIDAADVLAMGDMNNDLEMLRWAGRSVAPDNAHPDVKAVVTEVVGHIESDGTAVYLEQLLSL